MSRKFKVSKKSLPKTLLKIGAGVLAIGGVAAIAGAVVDYVKDDSKNINISYEIGGLNAVGQYVEDESTIYTKEKFACDGLQATLDFDSQISYQVFYYDILDNFIDSSDTLTTGYSEEAPLNGAYARIMITPLDDEDGKISWNEKYDYASQLNLSVSKEADNVNSKFTNIKGNLFTVVNNIQDAVFENGFEISTELNIVEDNSECATTKTIVAVNGGYTLTFTKPTDIENANYGVSVFEFTELGSDKFTYSSFDTDDNTETFDLTLAKSTKYILISVFCNVDGGLTTITPTMQNYFKYCILYVVYNRK